MGGKKFRPSEITSKTFYYDCSILYCGGGSSRTTTTTTTTMKLMMRRHVQQVLIILVIIATTWLAVVNAQQQQQTPSFFINSTSLSSYSKDTTEPIAYQCAFINAWVQDRQPIDYPVGQKFNAAHWGPPVIVTHNANYQLWCDGCNASSGFADYAMTGKTAALGTEIQDNNNNSWSFTFGNTQYVNVALGQNLNAILVDGNHPLISAATKAEPSPDWFTGFYDFNTIDSATNRFYQTFSINTFPWDAGVDGGLTYKARPDPLASPHPIGIFTYLTTPSGVFITADKAVVPVAEWHCELAIQKYDDYGDKIYQSLTPPDDGSSNTSGDAAINKSIQNVVTTIVTTMVVSMMMMVMVMAL